MIRFDIILETLTNILDLLDQTLLEVDETYRN